MGRESSGVFLCEEKFDVGPGLVCGSISVPVDAGVIEITHHKYEFIGCGGYLLGRVGVVSGIGEVDTLLDMSGCLFEH